MFVCVCVNLSEKLLMYRLFKIRRPSPGKLHKKCTEIERERDRENHFVIRVNVMTGGWI